MAKREIIKTDKSDDSSSDGKSSTPLILKAILLGVGALAVISIGLSLFKLALIALVIGGVGYGGYRLLGGGKELPDGDGNSGPKKRLSSGGSPEAIDARMKELDALDKKLDEQLAKLKADNDRG